MFVILNIFLGGNYCDCKNTTSILAPGTEKLNYLFSPFSSGRTKQSLKISEYLHSAFLEA